MNKQIPSFAFTKRTYQEESGQPSRLAPCWFAAMFGSQVRLHPVHNYNCTHVCTRHFIWPSKHLVANSRSSYPDAAAETGTAALPRLNLFCLPNCANQCWKITLLLVIVVYSPTFENRTEEAVENPGKVSVERNLISFHYWIGLSSFPSGIFVPVSSNINGHLADPDLVSLMSAIIYSI